MSPLMIQPAFLGAFFHDLANFPFLRYAVLTGALSAIACGFVGSYVTTRRITYIAGAIAHCTLGGMGVARYLEREVGWTWANPMLGALVAALLAAVIIGFMTLYGREREDTVLSAIWAIGMAVGILFISQTGGYNEDLMSYLFGNILMVTPGDLWRVAILDVLVVGICVLFYNKLLAISFDEEHAKLRGLHVEVYYFLLLILTAVTVVVMVQVVGIVMVIALLALPAASATLLTRRLWQTILVSCLFCVLCTTGGLALSYGPDFPGGATIVVLTGVLYLVLLCGKAIWRTRRHRRQSAARS